VQCSTVYETASVGFDGDNFYNLVVGFDTTEKPFEVVEQLREIEDHNGRVREGARFFRPRTLDLDLLLYDDLILEEGRLQLRVMKSASTPLCSSRSQRSPENTVIR